MGEVYTYNATHLTTVRDGSVSLTQVAETGAVGDGSFAIDDTAGTQAIVGQKDFSLTQSSCSVPLVHRGFIDTRTYGRDAGKERAPHVGAARGIGVRVTDLNAMLGFRLIDDDDGNRGAETIAARGAWLMGSDYVSGLFADNGRCSFSSSKGMDKADYRNQFPGDVLADMATAALGYNYHVNDWGAGPELTFRDDNASTADSSTLRISNVLADQTAVTLAPFKDATLSRRPDRVYSKLALVFAKGTVIEERTATATAFNGERGGVGSNSNIKNESTASQEAAHMLFQHSTEEDLIECTVLVTSAQVNLILAGQRIEAKFSHLSQEGYSGFTWFRILARTVKPIVADGALYELDLRLSPQEAPAPPSGVIQSTWDRFSEGGGLLNLADPVTPGNHLIYAVVARTEEVPLAPSTSVAQPRFGATAWTIFDDARDSAAQRNGTAIYWKEADTDEQSGYITTRDCVAAIWEIAGFAPGSATVISVTDQTGGTTYPLGSLGTVAVGDFAVATWVVGDDPGGGWPWGGPGASPSGGYAWDTIDPDPGLSVGWTKDISRWAYDDYSNGYFIPVEPWGTIAHALGTGVALSPSIQPGQPGHGFGGVAVKITP